MKIMVVVLQGITQGLTEFLPVSSSGHLAIIQNFFNINENNLTFNLAFHFGTLLSVIIVYFKYISDLITSFLNFFVKFGNLSDKNIEKNKKIVLNLIVSFCILFLIFIKIPFINISIRDIAKKNAEPPNMTVIGCSLILTSILLIIGTFSKKIVRKEKNEYNFFDAFLIGFMQLISSALPGLSRSGSLMSIGLCLGASRNTAIDYSFLLGIPTILAACIIELKDFYKSGVILELNVLLIGVLSSMVFGLISILLFKYILKNDKTWAFALYTFCLGLIVILYVK